MTRNNGGERFYHVDALLVNGEGFHIKNGEISQLPGLETAEAFLRP